MKMIHPSCKLLRITLRVATMAFIQAVLHAEVNIGDDRLSVIEALGQPQGRIEMGSLERMFFERGEIQLRDGLVTRIELISEEVAEARRQQEARDSEARRVRGEAIKADRLADPDFRDLPASRRYAFWRDFRREFPEVDVFVQYSDAKAAHEQDLARQRDAERLANVERRVAEAERRAEQAETTARTLSTPSRIDVVHRPILIHSRQHARPHPWPSPLHSSTRPKPESISPNRVMQPGIHMRIDRSSSNFNSNLSIGTAQPLRGFAWD